MSKLIQTRSFGSEKYFVSYNGVPLNEPNHPASDGSVNVQTTPCTSYLYVIEHKTLVEFTGKYAPWCDRLQSEIYHWEVDSECSPHLSGLENAWGPMWLCTVCVVKVSYTCVCLVPFPLSCELKANLILRQSSISMPRKASQAIKPRQELHEYEKRLQGAVDEYCLQWPKLVLRRTWRILFWMQRWANQLHGPLALGECKPYKLGKGGNVVIPSTRC